MTSTAGNGAHVPPGNARQDTDEIHETPRTQYIAALRNHDWTFEFSDDGSQYRRGREELAALRQAQPIVDPSFQLWNAIAPLTYRISVDPTQEPSS